MERKIKNFRDYNNSNKIYPEEGKNDLSERDLDANSSTSSKKLDGIEKVYGSENEKLKDYFETKENDQKNSENYGQCDECKTAKDIDTNLNKQQKDVLKVNDNTRVVKYGKFDVIQPEGNFEPNTKDHMGRTNIDIMKRGNAPIGNDGKSVNLHHSDQSNNGPLVECRQTTHQENDKALHPDKQRNAREDDPEFRSYRKEYWKNRGHEMEQQQANGGDGAKLSSDGGGGWKI